MLFTSEMKLVKSFGRTIPDYYYPFQNRMRVIASWITRERKQLLTSGFHQNVAKTRARNRMQKLKLSSRSIGEFEGV
jgi:hypothetical protein